jgi:steroid 5-alpha reductase family enzyme
MVNVVKADEMMPAPAKISLWVMCSLLLTYHLMAVTFAAAQGSFHPGVVAGALLMILSTMIEGGADWQKQQVKERDPAALATAGLYRRWRHPNYAGEIGLQIGLVIMGLSSVSSIADLLVILLSPAYIMILMVAEARRVDASQELRHGESEEYRAWRRSSGSLLPKLWSARRRVIYGYRSVSNHGSFCLTVFGSGPQRHVC